MSRKMPGRVRQEGIELYENGQLEVVEQKVGKMTLLIANSQFTYSLNDDELSCTCPLFAQKGYCQHLAATEYFFKNDAAGKELLEQMTEKSVQEEELIRRTYFGGLFLDELLLPEENKTIRYQLSVQGQLIAYDSNINWTLKISRLPDQRSYVIKDIGAFLKVVADRGNYQIGKNYYEQICLEQFDKASQDIIVFLQKLVPKKIALNNDIIVGFGRYVRLPLVNFEEGLKLFSQVPQFQFEHKHTIYSELSIMPLTAEAGLFTFTVAVHTKMIELLIEETEVTSLLDGNYLLLGNQIFQANGRQSLILKSIRHLVPTESGIKKVQIDFQDQDRLALLVLDFQELGSVLAPKKFHIQDFKPEFHFSLDGDKKVLLRLYLRFSNRLIKTREALEGVPFAFHSQHLHRVMDLLATSGFEREFETRWSYQSGQELYDFFARTLPRFSKVGQVSLAKELENVLLKKRPNLFIDRRGSLLDITFEFDGIAQQEIDAAIEALWNGADYFSSDNGKMLIFDEETKKISKTLQQLRAKYGQQGKLSVLHLAAYQLAETFARNEQTNFSQSFLSMARDLARPEAFPLPQITINADLRSYQQVGVQWFSMLDHYGFGGILADEMGLGKTLQTIAFLSNKSNKDTRVLILAPSSLIYNWLAEFKRFSPHSDVVVVHGNKEKRMAVLEEDHQIVITSYASFRQDSSAYCQRSYDYLILDEAQVMKNAQTKIAQLLRNFDVGTCFALSGTPIENQLLELWSIFQIVLPGLFPSKKEFSRLSVQQISRMIQPFVLRRKKEDVLQELPDLIETNILNELTDEQKVIYLAQLQQMQASLSLADDSEIRKRKLEILTGITRLRQICNTPSLFMDDYKGKSGKLESLWELLLRLKEENRRVLIFSQFRQMLDLIQKDMEKMGLSYYLLTGSTPVQHRQEMTRAFNAGSRDVFLISLKAGGVGLNLTGADTVILVDLWWNPAVEEQALSRAHRMGQTEKVEFFRLITRGTIEEKISALQETKKQLVSSVLDGTEERANLTPEDIRNILGLEQ